MVDVLVVGGGPTGLGAAILAAQAGLEPVVIEPRPGVIDKACGEGLMPGAVALLERMGVAPAASHPFVGIRYIDQGSCAEGLFPQGPGLGVRRTALHAALLARADALGIRRLEARVDSVRQADDGVEAAGLRARYLLAADGLHSPVRRQLGLQLPPRRPPRLGLRRHYSQRPWSPFVEVYWTEFAEAYVTPVAADLVGVAILFDPEGAGGARGSQDRYARLLARFPALQARLQGEPATIARGAGPFEQRVSRRVAGRVLLAGDAAGYLDPLTGEGLRLGWAAADAAIRCVAADRPADYERAWRALARRYWWLTSALLRLRRSPLRRAMVPFLRRSPRTFGWIVGLLAE